MNSGRAKRWQFDFEKSVLEYQPCSREKKSDGKTSGECNSNPRSRDLAGDFRRRPLLVLLVVGDPWRILVDRGDNHLTACPWLSWCPGTYSDEQVAG